jgi:pyruvate dehydrogenase E1 component beta subunit
VMQSMKALVAEGYDPEVIDLISLKPLDMETIATSVRKTHKVIIVEEGMRSGSIGASIIAEINDQIFDELDAPVIRLASQDIPTPYNGNLERLTIVQPEQIVAAVRDMMMAKV